MLIDLALIADVVPKSETITFLNLEQAISISFIDRGQNWNRCRYMVEFYMTDGQDPYEIFFDTYESQLAFLQSLREYDDLKIIP